MRSKLSILKCVKIANVVATVTLTTPLDLALIHERIPETEFPVIFNRELYCYGIERCGRCETGIRAIQRNNSKKVILFLCSFQFHSKGVSSDVIHPGTP